MTKKPFVFGTRPSHIHKVEDPGSRETYTEIECNSPYCDFMDAHPLHQENQRAPWANVEE